jgi:hypothetical protein
MSRSTKVDVQLRQWLSACLGALALLGSQVQAQVQPGLKLSGFGTLGLTYMDSEQADFKGTFADAPNGAGRSGSLSSKPDSRLAVQANYGFSEQLEAVAQLMTRHNNRNNYMPSLQILNLQYSFDRNNSLRIGRSPHPYFLASDYRLIGYANPFLRAPVEVNLQSMVSHSDMLQLRHRHAFTDGSLTVQLGYGAATYAGPSNDRSAAEDKAQFRRLLSIDLMYESNDLTLRLVHNRGVSDYEVSKAKPLFSRAAADNPTLAQQLSLFDKRVNYTGLGAVYDPGGYIVQSEYTLIHWDEAGPTIAPNAQAFYLLGGWRFGALMPYAIYAKRWTAPAAVVTGFQNPAINAGMSVFAANSANAQHSYSLGLRWDFMANMALKLQWDRITVDSPAGASYLVNPNPLNPPRRGQHFQVLGLNLDFVF